MLKRILSTSAVLAITVVGSQVKASAQSLAGVWDVSVTVVNCETGAPVRTVNSIQSFTRDNGVTETANTTLRGPSLGTWTHLGGADYVADYWFFRFSPTGVYTELAKIHDQITLAADGRSFTSIGTVSDFSPEGAPIDVNCFTHAATLAVRLPSNHW